VKASVANLDAGCVEQLGTADEFKAGAASPLCSVSDSAKRNMILHEGGCAGLMWAFKIDR
jgi:hypothetical protein